MLGHKEVGTGKQGLICFLNNLFMKVDKYLADKELGVEKSYPKIDLLNISFDVKVDKELSSNAPYFVKVTSYLDSLKQLAVKFEVKLLTEFKDIQVEASNPEDKGSGSNLVDVWTEVICSFGAVTLYVDDEGLFVYSPVENILSYCFSSEVPIEGVCLNKVVGTVIIASNKEVNKVPYRK
jgi:hypothetical protein